MFLWVESQPTLLAALLVFGFCYLLAAVIYGVMSFILKLPGAAGLHTTSPTMLSAIGVITGLVIAFVASHVWSNLNAAENYVIREASAIRDTVLLADTLPDDMRTKVHAGIKAYLHFIDTEDWPEMARGQANLRRPPPGLTDVMHTVLAANLTGSGQQISQQRIVGAIQQALEARRQRILLSEASIETTQWATILILAILMLIGIRIVHNDRTAAMANLFIFASAIAACLVLLIVSDRPFSLGGVTLQPSALHEITPD